jgi:hypothetical protein
MSVAIQNPDLRGYRERKLGYAGNEASMSDDPYGKPKEMIARGIPIQILTCYDGSCTSGHYRVVKGYDDNLHEFLVHDPWYGAPYFGPDVHFSQSFLAGIWQYWSNCWALMTGPWSLTPVLPERVAPGVSSARSSTSFIRDQGLSGQNPRSPLSRGSIFRRRLSLVSGSSSVSLSPYFRSGDSARVVWSVRADPLWEGGNNRLPGIGNHQLVFRIVWGLLDSIGG